MSDQLINLDQIQPSSGWSKALKDLNEGLITRRELWLALGWKDVKLRYRRSVLGPFWLTLSMAVTISAQAVVFAHLFKMPMREYLPYLTLGTLCWNYLATLIADSCQVFAGADAYIRNIKLPYSVYVAQLIWRNLIIFAHNFVIYLFILLIFQLPLNAQTFLFLPAFILTTLNAFMLCFSVGMISARFRDIPLMITNVMGVAIFLTPVMWKPEMLGDKAIWLLLNPFYHFISILRAPLLGQAAPECTWMGVLAITAINTVVSLFFFQRYRRRLLYWV